VSPYPIACAIHKEAGAMALGQGPGGRFWSYAIAVGLAFSFGCEPASHDASGRSSTVSQAVTAQPDSHCAYKQFAGHDYWFCKDDHDWATAQSKCSGVSMHLVHVDNTQENQFVAANADGFAWIGATDQQTPNQWTWSDDNTLFWSGTSSGTPVAGQFSSW